MLLCIGAACQAVSIDKLEKKGEGGGGGGRRGGCWVEWGGVGGGSWLYMVGLRISQHPSFVLALGTCATHVGIMVTACPG